MIITSLTLGEVCHFDYCGLIFLAHRLKAVKNETFLDIRYKNKTM